jgi:cell division transport system permease protein
MSESAQNTSKKGLRTSYISTVIGISLVLFLIGLVLAGIMGLETMQRQARENLQGDLFFVPEMNAADIKQVEQELKSWDCFSDVTFVSPERAIQEFKGADENSEEILKVFEGESPLPPTVNFSPKSAYATKAGMLQIKQRLLKAYSGVIDEVNYDLSTVEDVNLGFKQIAYLTLLVAVLLIIVAVAMINNTIRLSLYSKRFTIKTMQLVGATGGFIRSPFLRQALFQGIVAAIIGMSFLMTVFFAVNNILNIIEINLDVFKFAIIFGALIALGSLLTVISTWFALNKYLRTKLDDLY